MRFVSGDGTGLELVGQGGGRGAGRDPLNCGRGRGRPFRPSLPPGRPLHIPPPPGWGNCGRKAGGDVRGGVNVPANVPDPVPGI
jgi:hypothetical protein